MAKILMFEDDLEFAELLSRFLERYNIQINNYDDPFLGLSSGISEYDMVILDLGLPGLDGMEVCQKIIEYHDIPIIISSARDGVSDKVAALELGADDFLAKPYDPQEMYARIISLLRRYKKVVEPKDTSNHLEIDLVKDEVLFNNEVLLLTQGEYEVLLELFRNKNANVSRDQILFSAESLDENSPKTLDVIVNRLRRKLRDDDKQIIRSIRGVGYKLSI
jgi:two-component system, OmpR family, response regulator